MTSGLVIPDHESTTPKTTPMRAPATRVLI
jgi:hypothetical protein